MARLLTMCVSVIVSLAAAVLVSGVGTASGAPPDVQGNKTTTTVHGKADNGAVFNGKFTVNSFEQRGEQLVAVGDLTGKLSNTGQGAAQDVSQSGVALPVNLAQTTASCQILDLVLGPLDLDLLGLVVHLDTVHLNITAQSGPGNLLGNLLCGLTGLLDDTPLDLGAILAILQQILGALG
ncbi:hypothetical protein [Mycobacterium sp. ACS4331]|uniref:hypothetical protein n=1 Tax=Mycobacterium sp. ACS4331 TaxID=1834121 RepID=UPI0009ED1E9F|nr:hypothetical protein [Mycobacterium sp. ACS4331]